MDVSCPAEVSTGADGALLCTDGLGAAVAWEPVPPVDFAAAREPFMAGFLIVFSCWLIGAGVAQFIRLVR